MSTGLNAGPGAFIFGDEERKEVMDVLESGYLSRYGTSDNPRFKRKVFTFEGEFAKLIGVKSSVAVNSGTSALLSALAALGIGPGDEVIVPGYTFAASMSSVVFSRAIPILAEIDESFNIDPEDVRKKITKRTKAIMPVHMLGTSCDMDSILKIAKEHNLYVIEDCCQALGGSFKGKRLGSLGDIGAFSLNHFKLINSGEGGVVTTNSEELNERAFGFSDQGHRLHRMGLEAGRRPFMGICLRMNELTGAVALAQGRKVDYILSELRTRKAKLKNAIKLTKGVSYRKLNDEQGDCATLLGLLFDSKEVAAEFAKELDSHTLSFSGWHVYSNMEHVINKKMPTNTGCPFNCSLYDGNEYSAHMLPKTDDILSRAVILSVGVVDKGLGAGYGINILSSDEEIKSVAENINALIKKYLS